MFIHKSYSLLIISVYILFGYFSTDHLSNASYPVTTNMIKRQLNILNSLSTDIFGRVLRCDYTNPRIKHSCVVGCIRCKRALMRHYDIGKCCDKCFETSAEIVEEPPEKCSTEFYYDVPILYDWVLK